jgi:hypothetical protein
MVTTALIEYLDSRTPFAQHLEKNKNVQGKAWTDKHGMMSYILTWVRK